MLCFFSTGKDTSFDLYVLRVTGAGPSLAAAGKPELFLGNRFGECFGTISHDGRWMLFASDQNGIYETWVTTYPKPGPMLRLSDGREPMWNPRVPDEVVYVKGRAMYAVDVSRGPENAGTPQELFDGAYPDVNGFGYGMAPDGRFLMLENKDILKPTTTLVVVTNFFDELRRRVPHTRK